MTDQYFDLSFCIKYSLVMSRLDNKYLVRISEQLKEKSLVQKLSILADEFQDKIVFSTSFGQEDQLLTDIIFTNEINIEVFTLDTGRLFEETYKLFDRTLKKYNKEIKVYFPDSTDTESLLSTKGPYSFYDSVENRVECCKIRKTKPLERALSNVSCWVTGLRSGQSESRKDITEFSLDEKFGIIKFNPLYNWSSDKVIDYLRSNDVSYNKLHDEGFISIGCEPCTKGK